MILNYFFFSPEVLNRLFWLSRMRGMRARARRKMGPRDVPRPSDCGKNPDEETTTDSATDSTKDF